jgi:DNA-binding response OmpR family regulator
VVDKNPEILSFLGDSLCLIVEPSQSFSATIQTCLGELGIPSTQVMMVRKFEEALKVIRERKPKLIVSEYDLGTGLGLALMELQSEFHEDVARISIIATKNSSDSAVAEAAEEQIDAFILKPFSADAFRQKLSEVFRRKMNPSDYMQKVRAGKINFSLKQFEAAVQDFMTAKTMDKKPTLACFYAGQSYQALGDRAKALAEFKEGRKHQPLHYKCLIGEFENLMEERNYPGAYELVTLIRANYPITSHRLGQIFIASVFTYHFDDVPILYQLFLKLEQRPPRLVQLTSMALLTAGRHWIQKKEFTKAMDCYEMGITSCGKDLNYVEKVVTDFINAGAFNEAQTALQKCAPSDVGNAAHARLGFRLDQYVLKPDQIIDRGRKLINAGNAEPEIFKTVVRLLAIQNKVSMAESVINTALKDHPEMREELYALLEKHVPKTSKA